MNALNKALKKVLNYRELGLIVALILLLIGAAIFTPSFYSFKSVTSMLANNAVYAVLTVGIMFVLLTGGIDISIGSILGVSGVAVTRLYLAFPNIPVFVWLIAGIAVGCICGAINGFIVGKMKVLSMIATLGTMYAFRGLAYVLSEGKWTTPDEFKEAFTNLAQYKIFGLRSIILWTVAIFAVSAFFLELTRTGRRLYAVGTSEESAVISGINVGKIKFISYILCGACSGLAGVLYASNYATVSSEIGTGYEMTAIAICILGGVSIVGGRGRIDGIIISTLLMSIITYILSLFPGFNIWQTALQGAIILIAVAVNLFNGRLAFKRELKERESLI